MIKKIVILHKNTISNFELKTIMKIVGKPFLVFVIALQFFIGEADAQYTKKFKTFRNEILTHYDSSNDSLKKQAALFLLENMCQRKVAFSQEIKTLLENIDSIHSSIVYPLCAKTIQSYIDSFNVQNGVPKVYYEYELMNCKDVINEIDDAFLYWEKGNFSKHISFCDFCNYILPPVIGKSCYKPWRSLYRELYGGLFERLFMSNDRCFSPFYAVSKINYKIRHSGNVNIKMIDLPFDVCYQPDKISNIRVGSCKDYSMMCAYAARAFGIPVAVDFTPQWPNRSGGHYWNSLLNENGQWIPYSGGASEPGIVFYPDQKMAKVYRLTYSCQSKSLPMQALQVKEKNPLPYSLNNPCIIDVTSSYVKTLNYKVDIPASINLTKNKVLYISVFDNSKWVPVDYAIINNGEAIFSNLGMGIVYLVGTWDSEKMLSEEFYPIEVTSNSNINVLKPDYSRTTTLTLSRKYPVFSGILGYSERMQGGYIEASNDSLFMIKENMGTIERFPAMYWDSIAINPYHKEYKYWRYVSPAKGWCNVAEISFVSDNNNLQKIIADSKRNDVNSSLMAFDNDPLTYYESDKANNGWIGICFDKPTSINIVKYLPRNDDNHVVKGHKYELCVYDKGKFICIGRETSISDSVTFQNVPMGGLYILHDLSKGSEERIFTISNNNLIWY